MKKILLLMIVSISLFAVPAKRTPTLVKQPDGTTFSLIGFGDERYHYAETLDGYVIIQGIDNFWYYAVLNTEGKFIPSEIKVSDNSGSNQVQVNLNIPKHLRESQSVINTKLQAYNLDQSIPVKTFNKSNSALRKLQSINGATRRELILCVQFSDLASTYTGQSFQDMINDDTWKGGIGGMNKYYKEVSYNNLTVTADYKDWITATNPKAYYADNDPNSSTHIKELVKQCIDAAHTSGVNFADYDNDGDGVVDGVFIVHAGKGAEEGSDRNYIWSHQGSISNLAITYDGKTFDKYITLPEKFSSGHVDIGVFCHEYGHMLGLPDTYDVNGTTNGASEGLGNWCLMAGGSWGADGASPDRPAHMSAFCKALLGYTTPTVVASNQSLSIPAAETNATSYKIWMDTNQSDEYMLIENRQKTGFDLNLAASGLLIYHVDKNLTDIWPTSNDINVTSTHMGIKLYEADGLEQMATAVNRGSTGDPYPGSTSNTSLTAATNPNSKLWDNTSSGVEINNISASASTMTANAVVPVYNGYNQQFYRKTTNLAYVNTTNHYGMVKCTPSYTGKLLGVRVFSPASKYSNISAAAFTTFSSSNISNQVGTTETKASDAVSNFIKLTFSSAVIVTQNVPIYIRIVFQTSDGHFIPVDNTTPTTGNSYVSSSDGIYFYSLGASYDLPVSVILQSDAPLPVELTSFIASSNDGSVILNWNTATEVNNYGFDIERSSDNINWQKIAFVQGHGNSNSPKDYSFTDKPNGGLNYSYRLKQIDFDGKYEFSSALKVTIDSPGKFLVDQNFPNPFNPETVINYQIPETGFVTLKIYDILGKEVSTLVNEYQQVGFHNAKFSIKENSIASGFYFYRVQAGNYSTIKKMLLLK